MITAKLNDVPIEITAKTTKAAVDNLKLKKNDCAYAAIFWWDPKEPPVTGSKMVTVFIQNNWVTIPLGNAALSTEPESEECVKMKDTPKLTDAVAKKYGYANVDAFLQVVNSSLNDFGKCPPESFIKQIESVREYEYGWKWHTFRYGPTCKAWICQMKEDSGSTPSDAQNDAWLHGYLSPGDYANEKSNALIIAEGSFDGPVLAGFCYTGTKDRPDPNMLFKGAPSYNQKDKDIFSVPVNIYRKTEKITEKIGRTTLENVRKK
ncbi:MAG: hypothetical protein WC593_04075 [Methanoregula sp.]